jgi:hypothetical protein
MTTYRTGRHWGATTRSRAAWAITIIAFFATYALLAEFADPGDEIFAVMCVGWVAADLGQEAARRLGRHRHHYLSTACLHGHHNDCDIDTRRYDGTWKHGATCKYCRAPCVCPHHKQGEHTEGHQ